VHAVPATNTASYKHAKHEYSRISFLCALIESAVDRGQWAQLTAK